MRSSIATKWREKNNFWHYLMPEFSNFSLEFNIFPFWSADVCTYNAQSLPSCATQTFEMEFIFVFRRPHSRWSCIVTCIQDASHGHRCNFWCRSISKICQRRLIYFKINQREQYAPKYLELSDKLATGESATIQYKHQLQCPRLRSRPCV